MALAFLAAFWIIVAVFLLAAPSSVLPAGTMGRRYGAIGCAIFAFSCILGLLA